MHPFCQFAFGGGAGKRARYFDSLGSQYSIHESVDPSGQLLLRMVLPSLGFHKVQWIFLVAGSTSAKLSSVELFQFGICYDDVFNSRGFAGGLPGRGVVRFPHHPYVRFPLW